MFATALTVSIILAALLVTGLVVVAIYNRLVKLRNRYRNAFAQIDVQLKRRHDLIPNLVATAQRYLEHERDTLEAVIQARNRASQARADAVLSPGEPQPMQALAGAEGALTAALGKLFALSEAYPDLKAQTTVSELGEELKSTENKVAFARQHYNDSVMEYNTEREKFPAVLLAPGLGFHEASLLEVITSDEQREAPKVAF